MSTLYESLCDLAAARDERNAAAEVEAQWLQETTERDAQIDAAVEMAGLAFNLRGDLLPLQASQPRQLHRPADVQRVLRQLNALRSPL